MTLEEAELTFRKVRWADTDGAPVCPSCGSVEAYEARRPNGVLRFRCKGCRKDFTVTSGTLFASHKTAFVLLHKFREAMAEDPRCRR
jgi:transposase-like protein